MAVCQSTNPIALLKDLTVTSGFPVKTVPCEGRTVSKTYRQTIMVQSRATGRSVGREAVES